MVICIPSGTLGFASTCTKQAPSNSLVFCPFSAKTCHVLSSEEDSDSKYRAGRVKVPCLISPPLQCTLQTYRHLTRLLRNTWEHLNLGMFMCYFKYVNIHIFEMPGMMIRMIQLAKGVKVRLTLELPLRVKIHCA